MDGAVPSFADIRFMKSKEQILRQSYLNKTDISILLGISYRKAQRVYEMAMELDRSQLGKRLLFTDRVRIASVIAVTGTNYNILCKQIKTA